MTLSKFTEEALVAVYGVVPPLPVPRSDAQKVRMALARVLFDRPFADIDDLGKFLKRRKDYVRHNHLNRYLVEATGLGPSSFTVTALSHPDIELNGGTTLLDFDKAHFAEVEAIVSGNGKEPRPYRESLYGLWTQSLVEGELVYGFLWAAGPFLWDVLEDAMFEWVDANFQQYNRSGNTQEAVAADIERQMTSPEPHEKARNEANSIGSRLINTMLSEEGRDRMFEADGPWVRRKITNDGREVRDEIVFSDARAMELVRFGSFHEDVAVLPDGTAQFQERVASLVEEFRQRLKELTFAQKPVTVA